MKNYFFLPFSLVFQTKTGQGKNTDICKPDLIEDRSDTFEWFCPICPFLIMHIKSPCTFFSFLICRSSFSSADLITQRSHSTKADDTLEEIQAQPLTESVVSFSGIDPPPPSGIVWPRRDVGSLTNLNPAETDISRLQNADRKRRSGEMRDSRAIEHTISLCDAFNVVLETDDPKPNDSDKSRVGQLKRSNSKHHSMIWWQRLKSSEEENSTRSDRSSEPGKY